MLTGKPVELEYEAIASSGIMEQLTEQFNEAKVLEDKIVSARKELAGKMKDQKLKLDQVFSSHESLRKKLLRSISAQEHQLGPERVALFREPKLTRFGSAVKKVELKTNFDGASKVVADYEAELLSISKLGLFKSNDQRDSLLAQFEFVFDAIEANRIQLSPKIRAHMFEYLVVRNDFKLANN
jgi:hypothetical protein